MLSPHKLGVAVEPAQRIRLGLLLFGALVLAAAIGGVAVALRSPRPLPHVADSTQITFDGIPKYRLHARGGNVYFNEMGDGRVELLRVPMVGGQPTVLDASSPGLYVGDVSADGNKLLVGAPTENLKGPYRLKLMDLASGSLQDVDKIMCNDASWAPGGKIAFTMGWDIFLADVDGSHQHKLLSAPGSVSFMRYSPDGKRLRFTVQGKLMTDHTIWEARADGSDLHEILTGLTDFPERCCGDWTPDGRYFLFQTNRNGGSRIWAQLEQITLFDRSRHSPCNSRRCRRISIWGFRCSTEES